MRFVFLLIMAYSAVFADYILEPTYRVEDRVVKSTSLFPSLTREFTLFTIEAHKTQRRIRSSDVIAAFAKHGIHVSSGRHRYIVFIIRSPIDITVLREDLRQKYLTIYPTLQITELSVTPRVYTERLPEEYTFEIAPKSLRRHSGTFSLKAHEGKRLFFDYVVDATIGVIHAKTTLKRNEELNVRNTTLKVLPFSQLKSEPLTSIHVKRYRLKHNVKAQAPISTRDVKLSPLVKRGKNITVFIRSGAVVIEFSAVARQDGVLHDIISVQKTNGERLKAKVTGLNQVEIQ